MWPDSGFTALVRVRWCGQNDFVSFDLNPDLDTRLATGPGDRVKSQIETWSLISHMVNVAPRLLRASPVFPKNGAVRV